MIGSIRKFFSEVGLELRKTTWPWDSKEKGFKKFKELTDSTLVVVVGLVILGAYVAGWDFIMIYVMKLFTMGVSS
jgi:preprotein translocase subunit SecE